VKSFGPYNLVLRLCNHFGALRIRQLRELGRDEKNEHPADVAFNLLYAMMQHLHELESGVSVN
jgi:hypothetical protein